MPRTAVVRPPAVAGAFYPGEPDVLAATVDALLDAAAGRLPVTAFGGGRLVALICPHAGYRYSGPVAASAYQLLRGQSFRRVVILSPSHRVPLRGLALPDCDAFETPLGSVPLWSGCRKLARQAPFVLDSAAHAAEHAIEVQLPFLLRALGEFELIPIVFGTSNQLIAYTPLLSLLDADTLVVVSTDLSHYLSYEAANELDRETLSAILARDPQRVLCAEACGRSPTATFVSMAAQLDWQLELLDYRNSGDTSGDRSRVVGYAALSGKARADA